MKTTFRGLALLSCLAVMTSASGAYAAQTRPAAVPGYHPKTFTLTDPMGDANGLNGQGFVDLGSRQTPVQNDSADLLKIQYVSTGKMVREGRRSVAQCTGFTVTVTLAAAPAAANKFYRLYGTAVTNDGLWWLQYVGTDGSIAFSAFSDEVVNIKLIRPVKVVGSTFTFTVTEADILATGESLAQFEIHRPRVEAREFIGGVRLAPVAWDGTKTGDGVFKPC